MTRAVASGSTYSHHYRVEVSPPLVSKFTVFCDFDGPILDVSDRYYNTYQMGLAEVQAIYASEGIHLPLQAMTKTQFWQMKQDRVPDLEIAMRSGLQDEQIDLFLKRVGQIVNQPALLDCDQLQPGVRWALNLLHAQGARLVLVTLRCQEQAIAILESYGLLHLFSRIQGTHEADAAYNNYAHQKTTLLSEVCTEYGANRSVGTAPHTHPPIAWMIGDTEADVLAGQALGLPTIALTCGIRSQNYLKQFKPTCIQADLLSAAHYLTAQFQSVSR